MCENEELKEFDGLYEDLMAQFAEIEKLDNMHNELMTQIANISDTIDHAASEYNRLHISSHKKFVVIVDKHTELINIYANKYKNQEISLDELENLTKPIVTKMDGDFMAYVRKCLDKIALKRKEIVLIQNQLISVSFAHDVFKS